MYGKLWFIYYLWTMVLFEDLHEFRVTAYDRGSKLLCQLLHAQYEKGQVFNATACAIQIADDYPCLRHWNEFRTRVTRYQFRARKRGW